MFYERDKLIRRMTITVDCLVVGCAFFLPFVMGQKVSYPCLTKFAALRKLPPLREYAWIAIIVVPLWIASLKHCGMYHSMRGKKFTDIFLDIISASSLAILIFFSIAFLFRLEILSRTFFITLFVCIVLMLILEKFFVLAFLHYIRLRGYNSRSLLIVGSGKRAKNFADIVEKHPQWGLKILGFVDEEEKVGMKVGNGCVIGSFKDLAHILDGNAISEVVFILPRKWLPKLEDHINTCEKVGVKATIAVDLFNTSIAKPIIAEFNGIPLLTLDSTPRDEFHLLIKRIMDISISFIAFVFTLPVFIISVIAIKLSSPGPVFFKQKRCGLYGRIFTLYKFRTMVVNADKLLDKVMHLNESKGPVFHSRNDPRVTPVGSILRKLSLDELPQLINVLKGDMSIIGPRPPIPEEVKKYERWHRRRLSFRPGIVCTWQVTRRFQPDFQQWMRMDLDYIDNWSLGLDMKILLRIFPALLKGFIYWYAVEE